MDTVRGNSSGVGRIRGITVPIVHVFLASISRHVPNP